MLRWQTKRCIARRCTIGALTAFAGLAGLAAGEAVAGGPSLVPVPTTITSIISVTSSLPTVTVPSPAPVPSTPVPVPAPPPVTTAVPQAPTTVPNPTPSAPPAATTAADAAAAAAGAAPSPGSAALGSPAGASGSDAAPAKNAAAHPRSVARRSATIVVRLDRNGRIEFVVYGRAPECELLGRFIRKAKRGVNRFTFAGRVAGQVLEPGIYMVTLNRLRSTQRVRLASIGVLVAEQGVRVVRRRPLCAVERRDGLPGGAWVAPPTEGSRDVSGPGAAAAAPTVGTSAGTAAVPEVLSAVGESVGETLDLLPPFVAGVALGLTLLGLVGVAFAWSRFWRGTSV